MKTIFIKLEDDVFFKLSELKAKLKADTWEEFTKKVLKELDD